jgi:hypothetical protein
MPALAWIKYISMIIRNDRLVRKEPSVRIEFTEEQSGLQQMLRKLVKDKLVPRIGEIDETDEFPRDLWELFGDMGLLQMVVPAEYGGGDAGVVDLCIVREEIAKCSFALAIVAHSNVIGGALALMVGANEDQKKRHLSRIGSGKTLSSLALTEPASGSDVAGMTTRAVRDGDDYVINGRKAWASFAEVADIITVFAKTDPDAGLKGISVFTLENGRNTPGLDIGKAEKKMGFHGVPSGEVGFDGVRVPARDRLGEEGEGWSIAMRVLNRNRPVNAAGALGIAEGAYEYALGYVKERHIFGQTVADFQGIQWMLADMATEIEAARGLVYRAAADVDAGVADARELSSMAKRYTTDMAMRVTTDCVQIMGAAGYIRAHPVERLMRDAKLTQIVEGANQVQKNIIARNILRRPEGRIWD